MKLDHTRSASWLHSSSSRLVYVRLATWLRQRLANPLGFSHEAATNVRRWSQRFLLRRFSLSTMRRRSVTSLVSFSCPMRPNLFPVDADTSVISGLEFTTRAAEYTNIVAKFCSIPLSSLARLRLHPWFCCIPSALWLCNGYIGPFFFFVCVGADDC